MVHTCAEEGQRVYETTFVEYGGQAEQRICLDVMKDWQGGGMEVNGQLWRLLNVSARRTWFSLLKK